MRIPLLGGAYAARSVIANAQRCINYFPEMNPKDSPTPVTQYQRPGLRHLTSPPVPGPGRGIFRASNGQGYAIIGQNVYTIDSNFNLQVIGQVGGAQVTPVKFVDNGTLGLLVDGTANGGWIINITSNTFAKLVDPTGTFTGADLVDYIDGFILFNLQGTNRFASTLNQVITFDPTYVAAKAVWPDPLQGLVVNRHEILLLGSLKSEIWYDAGNPNFPFALLPGAYIEHGVLAKYSIATQDISTYWLSRDLQGEGLVMRHTGYQTKRVSNHALEVIIRRMVKKDDAIGYCYQQDGHTFYVLQFPSADQTWVFDEASQEWHQRSWTDANGVLHRDRTNCHALIGDLNVCLDWENGDLYALDLEVYTDEVKGLMGPISFIRGFPHVQAVSGPGGMVETDGKRMKYNRIQADIEVGMADGALDGLPAEIGLRWSIDRGRTFLNTVLQSNGARGEYLTSPLWRSEGIARDMVFEISHSIDGPVALQGLYADVEVLLS